MAVVGNTVVIERGIKGNFFSAYDAATPLYPQLCTEIPSDKSEEKYGWLGAAPNIREWVDERQAMGLLDYDYTLKNKLWEATMAVSRSELEDDQLGQILIRARDMGQRARRHPDDLLATLVGAGATTLCYDGQYFFSASHASGSSGTLDNVITHAAATGTAPTQAEFSLALDEALVAMVGYKDDTGKPFVEDFQFNPSNLVVMVPVALYQVARATLQATQISATTNPMYNIATLLLNNRLTSAVYMYTIYTGGVIKPFFFQRRTQLETGFQGLDSETGFMRDIFHFGVRARYNMGYGLWQYCVRTEFT
jgi:phage major head subunit gpT-like protein